MTTALVFGLGVTGRAVARAVVRHGWSVVLGDDAPGADASALADELGVSLSADPVEALAAVDLLLPAPGVPEGHPVVQAALQRDLPVRSEFDLAQRWERDRAGRAGGRPRPFVGVTGTDGKTTVTTMVTEMLRASGRRAAAVGNTEVPLVEALEDDVDVFVVEASSFRLRFAEEFRPVVAAWLNFSPDHLDWHPTVAAYAAAKARIWEHQEPGDLAVACADDPVVLAAAGRAPGRVVTFGRTADADWTVRDRDRMLVGPDATLVTIDELSRGLPHDISNALAAGATALAAGASLGAVRNVLRGFRHLHHRVELVLEENGVRWYDDSKATTPNAVRAAIRGFDHVVLIAGGRNKGLDLSMIADESDRVRHVVAIGDSAGEVRRAFEGVRPVEEARDMDHAVRLAAAAARAGDAVLLSPGCASFDWYRNYNDRGDDFARAVRAVHGRGTE